VVADSGEGRNSSQLPYLQNDKQQDGVSTNICLRFLLPLIINSRTGQVKFVTHVNFNICTLYMQNNYSFKLLYINYQTPSILIQSVSLLYFPSQFKGVRSIHISWLAQSIDLQ
jgi:hypothetical protein